MLPKRPRGKGLLLKLSNFQQVGYLVKEEGALITAVAHPGVAPNYCVVPFVRRISNTDAVEVDSLAVPVGKAACRSEDSYTCSAKLRWHGNLEGKAFLLVDERGRPDDPAGWA